MRLQENEEPGSVCGKIIATDADSGDNGRVHLELLKQLPVGNKFRLDGSKLICDDVLDREHSAKYWLMLRATDYGKPAKSTEKMVPTSTFIFCFLSSAGGWEVVLIITNY